MGTVTSLASATTVVRLSLHVLAACVWIGGQLVVAGLMPTVKGLGEGAPQRVARAFGRLSWPAFWLLVATGVWNYAVVGAHDTTGSWNIAFMVKMAFVLIAGGTTFLHTRAKSAALRGAYAGLATLASIVALVLGVALAG
jgi:putative copper export protein